MASKADSNSASGIAISILILGKPGVGKTTVIREMARVLSDEMEKRVIIIDTSNEHYRTSRVRGSKCNSKGVNYVGAGLSGGAVGALTGPALMIGCEEKVFDENQELFSSFCRNYIHMGNDMHLQMNR